MIFPANNLEVVMITVRAETVYIVIFIEYSLPDDYWWYILSVKWRKIVKHLFNFFLQFKATFLKILFHLQFGAQKVFFIKYEKRKQSNLNILNCFLGGLKNNEWATFKSEFRLWGCWQLAPCDLGLPLSFPSNTLLWYLFISETPSMSWSFAMFLLWMNSPPVGLCWVGIHRVVFGVRVCRPGPLWPPSTAAGSEGSTGRLLCEPIEFLWDYRG